MAAKLIQVIEATAKRGNGTEDNPVREVFEYYSTDGKLLATHDPRGPKYNIATGQWELVVNGERGP